MLGWVAVDQLQTAQLEVADQPSSLQASNVPMHAAAATDIQRYRTETFKAGSSSRQGKHVPRGPQGQGER